jgi:hypothetical protein
VIGYKGQTKNVQENYVLFAVILLKKKTTKCTFFDAWVDESAHASNLGALTRKLPAPYQLEHSTYCQSRQLSRWIQLSSKVSPHPEQAADEDVEEDGKAQFLLALFFYFRPDSSCAASNSFITTPPFLSFYLHSLFIYFLNVFYCV